MLQRVGTASIPSSPTLANHRLHLTGLALVMGAAALWATVGVASQLIPHDLRVPDEAYGFARTAVAGPALLLLAFMTGGLRKVRPQRGSLNGFVTFGICCAVFQIGLFRSFTLLGVTVTVFLTVCLPPVLAVAWALLRQPSAISRGVLAALLMAIAGLAAFSSTGFAEGSAAQTLSGLALSGAASVAFVVMSSTARELSSAHTPLLVSGLGLSLASLILAGAVTVVTPEAWHSLAAGLGHWKTAAFLLYLGLIPTALAYLLYCSGMARCRSAACGLIASMIEPAVAAGLAVVLLSEFLSPWKILGCALLFAAMFTLWFEEQQAKVRAGR